MAKKGKLGKAKLQEGKLVNSQVLEQQANL